MLIVGGRRRWWREAVVWLDRLGFEVIEQENVESACAYLDENRPDLIVTAWRLRARDRALAVTLLDRAMGAQKIPLIALCGNRSEASAAYEHGVAEIVHGRYDGRIVAERAARIVRQDRDREELQRIRSELDDARRELGRRRAPSREAPSEDRLTGLPSRRAFEKVLRGALAAGVSRQRRVAVLLFDVDRFRYVNHSLGRARANGILQEIAQRLSSCLRSEQLVGFAGSGSVASMVARLGGDQFAVLLSRLPAETNLLPIVEHFRSQLSRNYAPIGAEEVHLTNSIGVAVAPEDGTTAEDLLQHAEFAAGEAADLGGGVARFYGSSAQPRTARVAKVTSLLTKALSRNELDVHYQPIVAAGSGRVVAAEALLRWTSPELGTVSPAEFVPLAEERGLMVHIGSWVLDQACRRLREWPSAEQLRMSVNVSISQLVQHRFAETVQSIAQVRGVELSSIELEISERGALRDDPGILSQLRDLRQLGCRLAIDDFGTGNSAVAYLKRFPLTTVKIDRSFVSGVIDSDEDATITRAMTAMARRLGLDVVAEGVELVGQKEFLIECGCSELQGYLFSRPVPADRFGELLDRSLHEPTPVTID